MNCIHLKKYFFFPGQTGHASLRAILIGIGLSSLVFITSGCKPPAPPAQQSSNRDNTGIFGKTTDKVTEFDANKPGQTVSDGKIDEGRLATPVVGSLAAYGPILENLSKLHIEQRVNLFYAEFGRYPKDFGEFKERILDADPKVQLPVLPGGAEYQYDVENHTLVVVEKN